MICKTKPSGSAPTAANTAFRRLCRHGPVGRRKHACLQSGTAHRAVATLVIALLLVLLLNPPAQAQTTDPEIGRILERALENAEQFRKQLPKVQYEARMRVTEWNGRGRLRGTAKATAIMRPGDVRPVTFLSREVQGKVRLPDDKENRPDENEKDVTLQEFAREHQIAERFFFEVTGTETIAGGPARRVSFRPRPNQPEKNTADRFLDTISGTMRNSGASR